MLKNEIYRRNIRGNDTTYEMQNPEYVFQSIVKICFHERRLQYMEREQIDSWRNTRPGERILDIGKNQLYLMFIKNGR